MWTHAPYYHKPLHYETLMVIGAVRSHMTNGCDHMENYTHIDTEREVTGIGQSTLAHHYVCDDCGEKFVETERGP